MKTTVNHFRRIYELGYHRLVPIIPPGAPLSENSTLFRRIQKIGPAGDARGKAPGLRGFNGWYGLDLTKDHHIDFDGWHDMGAGVGIKTGQGLVAIDADTLNKEHARIIKQAVEKAAGSCPPLRIGQFPKALYLVRTDPNFIYTRIEFGERDAKGRLADRVEILADNRQFVAHGIHPKTSSLYDWRIELPHIDELPFVSGEALHAMLDELRPLLPAASELVIEGAGSGVDVDQDSLRGDPKLVEKAVHSIANTSAKFPTRESYLAIGYAIKAALPDDPDFAFELFADWCLAWQDGENDTEIITADWDRMKPPFRRGAQYLYRLADEEGDAPGSFTTEIWFDHAAAAEAEKQAPLSSEKSPNRFEEIQQKAAKFVFEPFYDAAGKFLTASAQPLIKGLLDKGAMSVVYGQSNVGKTFVTLDIAYHIATGKPYAGMKTARGHVIYLSAEGGNSIVKRLAALCSRYGTSMDVDLSLLRSPIDLRRPDADLLPLIYAIKSLQVPVSLIVVDTLSRAMAGGDENSPVDMGLIVTHFDKVREHTDAHLMAVHHSGKNQAAGARGHSLLRAATDTELEVTEGLIEAKKQRDLDRNWSSAFSLDVHTLGVDPDGDQITSCTVNLVRKDGAKDAEGVALTPSEGTVVEAVEELEAFAEGKTEGVSVAELTDFLSGKLDDTSANAMRHHMKRLVAKGVLTKCQRGRWKIKVAKSGQPSGQSVFE